MPNKSLIFLFFLVSYSLSAQTDWKLRKESEGIKVYTRKTAISDICEFKATTVINSTIDAFIQKIVNSVDYPKWISQIKFAKNIEKSDKYFIVYYQIEMPIGFKNRDIVLLNQIQKISNTQVQINLKTIENKYPEQKDFVRITEGNGFWNIQQLANNNLQVTYQFFSDPKGSFPAWLINLFLVDGPFKTLQNLKNNPPKS